MKKQCLICPHRCQLAENETGFCRARRMVGGEVTAINYGKITALALDPIEKKPLHHFHPGSNILSVGSFGCNLRCGFCQNHRISMSGEGKSLETVTILPAELADRAAKAVDAGNIGVAFTYNEPFIGYEYLLDGTAAVRAKGLKNVLVTNGYVCEQPLKKLLPAIDAMNIDLKGFRPEFYRQLGGDLETVKQTIRLAQEAVHVEVTTLIIPGENDSEAEMTALARWLASLDPEIVLHISRFFPQYQYGQRTATPVGLIHRLTAVAGAHLKYVYPGNC
ncbi:MAG: AmmeMemoRadiSam system radical SAM enzyme [Lachnospiraceae bacterium]|nr:AmmeMemoRadiSam system radical SAM enzyme [Lachnospiraceae bacterium]